MTTPGKSVVPRRSDEDAVATLKLESKHFDKLPSRRILRALMGACAGMNNIYKKDFYGSTACITLAKRVGNTSKIYNANVGDSLAVRLMYDQEGNLVGKPQLINHIHSLDPKINPSEYKRVNSHERGKVVETKIEETINNILRKFTDYRCGDRYDNHYRNLNMSRSVGDCNNNKLGHLNTFQANLLITKVPPGGKAVVLSLTDAFAPPDYPENLSWIANTVTSVLTKPHQKIAETLTAKVKEIDWGDDDASAVVMDDGGGAVFDGHGNPHKNDVSKKLAEFSEAHVNLHLKEQFEAFEQSPSRERELLEESLLELYEELVQEVQTGSLDGVKAIIHSIQKTLGSESKSEDHADVTTELSNVLNGKFSISAILREFNPEEKLTQQLPIHYAAKAGNEPMLKYLLEHGANPMLIDDQGFTPFHYLTQDGHLLKLLPLIGLLKNDALKPDGFLFFLNLKFSLKNPQIIMEYLQTEFQILPISISSLISEYTDPFEFEYILIAYLEKNPNLLWEKTQSGQTLLSYAIENSSLFQVELILHSMYEDRKLGKAPENFDKLLEESFRLAVEKNKIEAVKLFLKNGYIFTHFNFLMNVGSWDVCRLVRDYIFNLPINPEIAQTAGKSMMQNRSHEDAAGVFEFKAGVLDKLPAKYVLRGLMDAGIKMNKEYGRPNHGSTACITLAKRIGDTLKLYNMSVGDSFAVYLPFDKNGNLIGKPQLIIRRLHTLRNSQEYDWISTHFQKPTEFSNGDYRLHKSGLNMSRAIGDFDARDEGLRNTPETNFLVTKIPVDGQIVVVNVTDAFDSDNLYQIAHVVASVLSKTPTKIADTLTTKITEENRQADRINKPDDASATVQVFRYEEKSQLAVSGAGVFDGHGCSRHFNVVSVNLAVHSETHLNESLNQQTLIFNKSPHQETEILEEYLIELYEALVKEVQIGTLLGLVTIIELIHQALLPDSKSENPVELKAEFKDVLNGKFNLNNINNPEEKQRPKLPLHYVAEASNNEMLKYLLAQGADLSLSDSEEKNAIHYAAENNNLDAVKLLTETKDQEMLAMALKARNGLNQTPISVAARLGHIKIVEYLLALNAEFTHKEFRAFDPFLCKLQENELKEIIQVLLKTKPNILWEAPDPLDFALSEKNLTLAKILINYIFDLVDKKIYVDKLNGILETNLQNAIKNQHISIVENLLQRGITPKNLTELIALDSKMIRVIAGGLSFKDLNVYLLAAIKNEKLECVKILLELGASTSYKDEKNKSALDYAKQSNDKDLNTSVTKQEKNRQSMRDALKENDKKLNVKLKILAPNKSPNAPPSFFTSSSKDKEIKDDKEITFDPNINPFIKWFDHLIQEMNKNPGIKGLHLKINLFIECVNHIVQNKWFEVNTILTRCHKHFASFPWSKKIYNTPKYVLIRERLKLQEYLSTHPNLKWFEEVTGCKFEKTSEQKQDQSTTVTTSHQINQP